MKRHLGVLVKTQGSLEKVLIWRGRDAWCEQVVRYSLGAFAFGFLPEDLNISNLPKPLNMRASARTKVEAVIDLDNPKFTNTCG